MTASSDAIVAASPRLRRELTPFAVLMITLSTLSPIFSIYGAGSDVLQHAGSGAAALFLLALLAAAVWGLAYAEIGASFPYAGGDYVAVGTILGPWAGIASLTVWLVTAAPGMAANAKFTAVYLQQAVPDLPVQAGTYALLIVAVSLALFKVRTSAFITGIFLSIEMLGVLVLIVSGLWHPARSLAQVLHHPVAADAAGSIGPVPLGVLALASISAAYATTGGNQAICFGEELHDPHRKLGNVIFAAAVIGGLATALPVVCVVLGAADLRAVLQSPAPFSDYFTLMFGPFSSRLMSGCVALAIFNATIASAMYYGRMVFSMGRDRILPGGISPWLGTVHEPSGVPRRATIAVGVVSVACCALSTHALIVFISGLTTIALALISSAVYLGRRRGLTGQGDRWRSPLFPLVPLLGIALSGAFLVAGLKDPDAGRPSVLLLTGCIALALLWYRHALRPHGWRPRLEK